jgi:signal recognition particle GTPase
MKFRFVADEPIDRDDLDDLGFSPFVARIYAALADTATPFVYGLLGPWGSGKTSVQKLLYGSPEISGYECASIAGATYRAGEAGAQATAQSERIRAWLVANRFQAISQASMISAKLRNTELASQWLRR